MLHAGMVFTHLYECNVEFVTGSRIRGIRKCFLRYSIGVFRVSHMGSEKVPRSESEISVHVDRKLSLISCISLSQEGFLNSGLAPCKAGWSWLAHDMARTNSLPAVMHCVDSCGPVPERL